MSVKNPGAKNGDLQLSRRSSAAPVVCTSSEAEYSPSLTNSHVVLASQSTLQCRVLTRRLVPETLLSFSSVAPSPLRCGSTCRNILSTWRLLIHQAIQTVAMIFAQLPRRRPPSRRRCRPALRYGLVSTPNGTSRCSRVAH